MVGDLTKGFDCIIELSMENIKNSIENTLSQGTGNYISDIINEALNFATTNLNPFGTIDDLSFRAPDDILNLVSPPLSDYVHIKLSSNCSYSRWLKDIPIKITLEMVIGINIGVCLTQAPTIQFARLNLKDDFGYCHVGITLDPDSNSLINTICNGLNQTPDQLLNNIINAILSTIGITQEQLNNKLKSSLQTSLPYIPLPVPLYIPDVNSTKPLDLIKADCRALEILSNDNILIYLLTFGGGVPANRKAFDKLNASNTDRGNNAAFIFSFKPYFCRLFKSTFQTALNLNDDSLNIFLNSFNNCKLSAPVVIDKDNNITLNKLEIMIIPPNWEFPFIHLSFPNGAFFILAEIKRSGTCYSAIGSLNIPITINHDNNNVIIDFPEGNNFVNADVNIDTWCIVLAAIAGIVIVIAVGPIVGGIIDALIGGILYALVNTTKDAIEKINGSINTALTSFADEITKIPEVQQVLNVVTIDDLTMNYNLNIIQKNKLQTPVLLSPEDRKQFNVHLGGDNLNIELKWYAVPGATAYKVDVLYGYNIGLNRSTPTIWEFLSSMEVTDTKKSINFNLHADRWRVTAGRWRVTALDNTGRLWQSNSSRWYPFEVVYRNFFPPTG